MHRKTHHDVPMTPARTAGPALAHRLTVRELARSLHGIHPVNPALARVRALAGYLHAQRALADAACAAVEPS